MCDPRRRGREIASVRSHTPSRRSDGGRHPGAGGRMMAPATTGRRGGGTRGGGPRELAVAGAHDRELDRRDQEQPVRSVRRPPEYVRRAWTASPRAWPPSSRSASSRSWKRRGSWRRPAARWCGWSPASPTSARPPPVVDAAAEAAADGHVHYTASLGIPALRQAISGYYAERFGVDVPAERIAVTTGASGALLHGAGRHRRRRRRGRCSPTPATRATARSCASTAACPSASPSAPPPTTSSPPGSSPRRGTSARRASCWPRRRTRPARWWRPTSWSPSPISWPPATARLYVDEIYGELVYDRSPSTVLAHTDDAFVINSFSKTFGMTGWRLGWMVVPPWAVDAVRTLAQNMYISPPAPAQHGGLAAFTPEVWTEVEERRRRSRSGATCSWAGCSRSASACRSRPEGAFYVYADISAVRRPTPSFRPPAAPRRRRGRHARPRLRHPRRRAPRAVLVHHVAGPDRRRPRADVAVLEIDPRRSSRRRKGAGRSDRQQ